MDRVGLADIEREIDAEARERFPGGALRQVVLLQYGDDPEIEPGDLWVRVLLNADGPDDYERSVQAFHREREAAMEDFAGCHRRCKRRRRSPDEVISRLREWTGFCDGGIRGTPISHEPFHPHSARSDTGR